MTLLKLSRTQLATQLGLLDGSGKASNQAVADMLRAPLGRWGISPKRDILKYARDQLRAAGVDDVSSVPRTLKRLIDIGECDEVYVGGESYLAPATPRWIPLGDGVATFLGVSEWPGELALVDGDHHDIIRRLRVATDEDAAALEIAGILEVSLAEWLIPHGYLRHVNRRLGQPTRSDKVSLCDFWDLLEETLTNDGLPLGSDAEVRTLCGPPGEFFGRYDSPHPEGRWTADPDEGLWCAYRRGYGDTHWHPCIIAVMSDGWRALDLYDVDEWRWAMLARGRRIGAEEVIRTTELRVQLSFPLPSQLRAAMDILGRPRSTWGWDVHPNGPDLWTLF